MAFVTKKKITFIIPLYNGQEYIDRCVGSVLKQEDFDLREIEILLLDDGSTDGTAKIARRYQKESPEIVRYLNHDNMGVARTRNRGIELARGQYIAFIDQDDYIDSDFCKILYDAATEGDYDVVFSGMKRPDENGRIVSKDIYRDTEFARLMCMSIWAKLHKTDFVRRNGIQLFDNRQGEDIAFTFEEYQKTDKMCGLGYCGYNWFYNHQSVSNTKQRGLTDDNIQAILRLQNRLFELDKKDNKMTTFFITMLSAYYIFFSGKGSTKEQFLRGADIIMQNLKEHRPKYLRNRYLIISPSGILPVFSFGVKCFIILNKLNILRLFAIFYCRGV